MFKYLSCCLLICCFGCSESKNEPVTIVFSADSNKILVSAIEPAALYQLKNNIKMDTTYQKLISVLQTPADDDSTGMEIEWPGKLTIDGDSLVFTPVKPFVRGKAYLVETIINSQFAKGVDILRADVGHRVKLQQKMLKR